MIVLWLLLHFFGVEIIINIERVVGAHLDNSLTVWMKHFNELFALHPL